jgi:DNA topoisomerase-1
MYLGVDGRPIHDSQQIRRIRSLVIPPAWADVWICPVPNGHIQATARDAKGRKQYRYHVRWREVRDETKYDRMIAFAQALPLIRERTDEHLALSGLPREKILATVVRLLECTLIRVGNEEYARHNDSFGLTTMRDHHVDVSGSTLHFEFRGKSGVRHCVDLRDRRLARIVKRIQDLPGEELFQYLDEKGERRSIESSDVNQYLRDITGQDITAKDFRTWSGTVLAVQALQECQHWDSKAEAKRNIVRALESVAKRLGNTKAICRKCYIHPTVLNSYLDGSLTGLLRQRVEDDMLKDLRPEEAAVVTLLRAQLAKEARDPGRKAEDSAQPAEGLGHLLKKSVSTLRRAHRQKVVRDAG